MRLGSAVTVVGSEAELLPLFDSPPPEIVAVLVAVIAVADRDTPIVITGYEAPPVSTSDLVQLTFWPETVHDQPVPVAPVGDIPDGSVSETVRSSKVDVFL